MIKKSIPLLLFLVILSFNVLAFSISLENDDLIAGETAVLDITTTTGAEKGDIYNVTWYDPVGSELDFQIGTMSILLGGTVFETYTTSIGTDWTDAYVVFDLSTGGNQTLYFNVTSSNTSLVINDPSFSPEAKLGSAFAVDFDVRDENNKLIDNAVCEVFGTDVTGSPLQACTNNRNIITFNGRGICGGILDPIPFTEGEQYLAKIRCNCGLGDNACFDEDGATVEAHKGEFNVPFTVTPWLSINTITDKDMYEVDDTLYVCANITNNGTERVPLDIVYNWRCQNGGGDASTDRILLGDKIEERGISTNTTQNQCTSFLIPDDITIEKGATNCYGATSVTVLDKNKNPVFTYDTTSSNFTLNVTEINPFVRWNQINDYTYEAVINIDDYDVDIKDIDIRINERLTDQNTPSTRLKSYTVTYSNGTVIPYSTEIQIVDTAITDNLINMNSIKKFNEVSVTILDVNTSLDEEFKVTVIVDKVGEQSMLAMILGLTILAIYFVAMGFINNNPSRLGYYLRWGSMIIGYIELLLISAILYAYSLGYQVTTLMQINLWIIGLLGFGVFSLTLYLKTVEMLRLDNYDKNDKKGEW